jgi:hypothetical protein
MASKGLFSDRESTQAQGVKSRSWTRVDVARFNSTQKTALAQAIFHRLVFEYLTCLYRFADAETADTKMHELLTAALESLPEIIHTKDGSAVVRELIVRGNAKVSAERGDLIMSRSQD